MLGNPAGNAQLEGMQSVVAGTGVRLELSLLLWVCLFFRMEWRWLLLAMGLRMEWVLYCRGKSGSVAQ